MEGKQAFATLAVLSFILLSVSSGVLAQNTQWWNNDWQFRRHITVTNNNNFAVLAAGNTINITLNTQELLAQGKINPSGNDIRIIFDNAIELNRIITSFNSPGTVIWFKTNASIPAGGIDSNYWVYYGNPAAGSPPQNNVNVWNPPLDSNTIGLWYFEEGAGAVANDETTHDYDMNLNGITWANSKYGYGIVGANGGYGLFSNDAFNNMPQGTVETWIFINSLHYPFQDIIYKDTNNAGTTSGLRINNNMVEGSHNDHGTNVVGGPLELHKWYHIAWVWDGSNQYIYINGELSGSISSSAGVVNAVAPNGVVLLNVQSGNHEHWLDGIIDGFRISNDAKYSFPYIIELTPTTSLGNEEVVVTTSTLIESPKNITYTTGNIDYNLSLNFNATSAFVLIDGFDTVPLFNDFGNHWVNLSFEHPELADGPHLGEFFAQGVSGNFTSASVLFSVNRPSFVNVPDLQIFEDSGNNQNLLFLPNFTLDNLTSSLSLSYNINKITNGNVVNCSIDQNLYLDCSTLFQNAFGFDDFVLEVSDGFSTVNDTFRVTVLPVNDPPELSDPPDLTLNKNSGLNNNLLNLSAFSSDPDNSTLLFSVSFQSNTNIVNCFVDNQNFLDCDVQQSQTGTSLVNITASDGEFAAEDQIEVTVTGLLSACGQQINEPGKYSLTNNVQSEGTCFVIEAPGVELDCNGKTITYAHSATGYGISSSLGYNLTIKNCIIIQGSSLPFSYGMNLDGISASNIENNLITTFGQDSHGIYGISPYRNRFFSNSLFIFGQASGMEFILGSFNNMISQNTVQTFSGSSRGISIRFGILSSSNIIEKNQVLAANNSTGLLLSHTEFNLVRENNVSTPSASESLSMDFSDSNTIQNNTLLNVLIQASRNNSLIQNTLLQGLTMASSPSNTIEQNSISGCFRLSSSSGALIKKNTITTSGPCSLLLDNSSAEIQGNTILQSSSSPALILQNASGNIFAQNSLGSLGSSPILLQGSTGNDFSFNNISSLSPVEAVSFVQSFSNTFHSNILKSAGSAVSFSGSGQNIFYNNIFNTSSPIIASFDNLTNHFNITALLAQNIASGPRVGGNFYARPDGTGYSQTCGDNDFDVFCDQPFAPSPSNIDYLPLLPPKTRIGIQGIPIVGQTVNIILSDPLHPNKNYFLALSTSIAPPLNLSGTIVPLTPNSVFWLSVTYPHAVGFSQNSGTLDEIGRANIAWTIPNYPGIAGLTVFLAFVSWQTDSLLSASPPVPATFVL